MDSSHRPSNRGAASGTRAVTYADTVGAFLAGTTTPVRRVVSDRSEVLVRSEEFEALSDYLADDGSFRNTLLWMSLRARFFLSTANGYTLDENGDPITTGFAVAAWQPRLEKSVLGLCEICDFLKRRFDVIYGNGHAFGGWKDTHTGMEMVMTTRVFAEQSDALLFGRRERQRVVWNLAGGWGIDVNTGARILSP